MSGSLRWLAGPAGTNLAEVPLPSDSPELCHSAHCLKKGQRAKGGGAALIDGPFADRLEVRVAVRWQMRNEIWP